MVAEISVYSGGQIAACALVDADVAVWARRVRWYLHSSDTKQYVAASASVKGTQRRVFLHRAVLGLAPNDQRRVDHANGDPLDNRRENLRLVTTAQNAQNQGSRRGAASRHRGVVWNKSARRWAAHATLNGRRHHLGYFDDEDEAGRVAALWRKANMPFSREAA